MQIKFKDIQEGLYEARVSQIKEEIGIYGVYLKLIFTITEGELAYYRFPGLIKPTSIRQSKFYQWVTNIIGREPETEFSIYEMMGKECRICLSKVKDYYVVRNVFMKE